MTPTPHNNASSGIEGDERLTKVTQDRLEEICRTYTAPHKPDQEKLALAQELLFIRAFSGGVVVTDRIVDLMAEAMHDARGWVHEESPWAEMPVDYRAQSVKMVVAGIVALEQAGIQLVIRGTTP